MLTDKASRTDDNLITGAINHRSSSKGLQGDPVRRVATTNVLNSARAADPLQDQV